MRPAFSRKSSPIRRRLLRRHRASRRRSFQDLGSGVGMPLFLQRQSVTADLPQCDDSEQETMLSSGHKLGLKPIEQPLPDLIGQGATHTAIAYANNLRLQGVTRARFRNNFTTEGVTTASAEGCEGCRSSRCVRVTGTLVSNFSVTTTVTLPRVADFPNLSACQQQRVQDAIDNVLAPHEQQHVSAFNTYNGSVSTPFDMTLCRGRFATEIQATHDRVESTRRSTVRAASDALDPFHFDVDLDCTS